MRRSLEESLGRLGLDRMDIALIHDPDDFMGQAADKAYPALAEFRVQGVVKAIGAGMNAAAPLVWLIERCDLDCVLVAGRYTLLDDSAADSLLPLYLRRGVAVLAGGVFNSGIPGRPWRRRTLRLCSGAYRPAGPRPPAPGCLRPLRRPAARRRTAVHPAPSGRDGRGSGSAHFGGDHSRHLLPLHPHPERAVR